MIVSINSLYSQIPDSDKLGMALEYFCGGKYHESLLLFEDIEKKYELNPRFYAYMGVCYYYDWQYDKACSFLDSVIPKLNSFSPHERSVYYYTDAESHFILKQYLKAIQYYELALTVCYEYEKGDSFYKLGFCYMFQKDWINAKDYFNSAKQYYNRYHNITYSGARKVQLDAMLNGCKSHITIIDINRKQQNDSTIDVSIDWDELLKVPSFNIKPYLQE
jgi:tetratricopeptide (TPR) repeat protein